MTASGGRRPPWWRRGRTIALVVGVAVVAGVLTVVLTNQGNKGTVQAAQQVALQPVADAGPNPFTGSVAASSATPSAPVSATASATTRPSAMRTVDGAAPGLYGGSNRLASCDVAKLADFLNADAAKGRAWAGVEGIDPSEISAYLRSLTPVVLRVDTRVTNHGFSNGEATAFQSVLQAGTAVLVDAQGLPRTRCACGNPLLPPTVAKTQAFTGARWPSFKDEDVVVVSPAPTPVNVIVVVDPSSGATVHSPVGGGGVTPSGSPSSGSSAPSRAGSSSPSSPSSPGSGSSSASSGSSGSPSHSATHSSSASSASLGSAHASVPGGGAGATGGTGTGTSP